MILVLAGIALLLAGSPTAVGVAPLAVGLLLAATPISLVLRAFAPPPDDAEAERRDDGDTQPRPH